MPEPAVLRFADIKVGDTAQFEVDLTPKLIDRFAGISGDTNPLHMDAAYAREQKFEDRVVHGMLGSSFFSRLVGMYLPGKYALYLSQHILFSKPMYGGMNIIIKGTVLQTVAAARTIKIRTQAITKETEVCLIDGEALVRVLE